MSVLKEVLLGELGTRPEEALTGCAHAADTGGVWRCTVLMVHPDEIWKWGKNNFIQSRNTFMRFIGILKSWEFKQFDYNHKNYHVTNYSVYISDTMWNIWDVFPFPGINRKLIQDSKFKHYFFGHFLNVSKFVILTMFTLYKTFQGQIFL